MEGKVEEGGEAEGEIKRSQRRSGKYWTDWQIEIEINRVPREYNDAPSCTERQTKSHSDLPIHPLFFIRTSEKSLSLGKRKRKLLVK